MKGKIKNKVSQIFIKLLACVLVVLLTCADFLFCGNYFISYAADKNNEKLDKQTEATIHKNVKFDAYFENDTSKTHYNVADVNDANVAINLDINVQEEGYLKNASISLKNENEENDINYKISKVQDDSEMVQENSDNKISLRQINKDEDIKLKVFISPDLDEKINLNRLDEITKITLNAVYVDGKGNETTIEKDVDLSIGWTGEYEIDASQKLIKYIPLDLNGTKKVLVQLELDTRLNNEENKILLPIESTNIDIDVPKFNGVLPEKVYVSANSTKATNGLDAEEVKFDKDNWSYDKNTGKLNINVKNEEKDNEVTIGKESDKYLITYTYPESAYQSIDNSKMQLNQNVNIKINVYKNEGTNTVECNLNEKIELTETVGKILSLQALTNEMQIGKGKMYANVNSTEKTEETPYETKWKINVGYTDNLDSISMQDEKEEFEDERGNLYNITPYIKYKQTIIKREDFMQVLGQNGKIEIYDEEGILLGIVEEGLRVDENGDYLVEYIGDIHKIYLKTTTPIAEGNITITNKKVIMGNLPYTKENIEGFSKIISTSSVSQKEKESKDYLKVDEAKNENILENTLTRAKLTISKNTLSTIVNNENVELKIELGNDKEDSDLYVNPVFDIELPQYIEDINVKEYEILYDDELVMDDIQKLEHNGQIILRVSLKGIQTKFSKGSITNGTNIVLNTDIKVNILTPNIKDQIKMYCYNQNASGYDNTVETTNGTAGLSVTDIEYAAPMGLISISNLSNYEDTGKQLMSVKQGTIVDKIQVYQKARAAKMNLNLVNNTGNVCNSINILGRIPFKGNKSVEKQEDLGTTIDTYIRSYINSNNQIPAENIKIYYSENGEATRDLNNTNNGWSTNINDYTKIKSYLIVIEGYDVKPGEGLNFSYDLEIPANISYNNNILTNYATYYIEKSEEANREEISEADVIGITTGKGPDLKIEQSVSGMDEDNTIGEYKLLKFTINVRNDGTETANEVIIKDELPKWTQYVKSYNSLNTSITGVEEYPHEPTKDDMANWNVIKNGDYENGNAPIVEWKIPSISPGETVTKEIEIMTLDEPDIYRYYKDYPGFTIGEDGKYYIVSNKNENNNITEQKSEITDVPEIEIKNIATVTASNFAAELKAESNSIKLKTSDLQVDEDAGLIENDELIQGMDISLVISVSNQSDTDKTNIIVEKILPEGLDYISSYISKIDTETGEITQIKGEYDKNTRKIMLKMDSLASYDSFSVTIDATIGNLNNGEFEKVIETNSTVYADNYEPIETNKISLKVQKPNLDIQEYCNNNNEYLQADEEVEYTVVVTNVGNVIASGIKISQSIPEELDIISAKYTMLGMENSTYEDANGNINVLGMIQPGDSITLKVRAKAKALSEDTSIVLITQVQGDNTEFYITNGINQVIEKSQTAIVDPDNNHGQNSGSDTQTVTGSKISGVAWLDANEDGKRDNGEQLLGNIGVIAINADTGDVAKDTNGNTLQTNTNNNGNYLLEGFPLGNYILIFMYDTNVYTTTLYQAEGVGLVLNSDAIERNIVQNGENVLAGVTDVIKLEKSTSNIDLGLISKEKFDLKIDKTVSRITVQNGEGTKVHNYNNSKLATASITGKQLNKSTVIIEYKIDVTNEGNIPGYAKNIVDYLPKELSFNSELNTDWYLGNDGYIYTTSLKDTLINPGETKELTLTLTKQMTETNTGLINNNVEIQEDYNEKGLKDRDSTAGNNAQGEDDISSADVLITVKTGAALIYTLIVFIALVVLAVGIYLILRFIKN